MDLKMKPILFNTEMVQAILGGRKSVTRRVVKPQPLEKLCYICMGYKCGTWTYSSDDIWKYWGEEWRRKQSLPDAEKNRRWTPPCHTDDILYVRETWNYGYCDRTDFEGRYNETFFTELTPGSQQDTFLTPRYFYRTEDLDEVAGMKWRPSIHMPKEAARLFLRVTGVRVERLLEMTERDAIMEFDFCPEAVKAVGLEPLCKAAWDGAIKEADLPRYGWDANPWVWAIAFERISKEEVMKSGS